MPGQSLGGGFRYLFILYPFVLLPSGIGHRTLDISYWALDISYWALDISYWALDISHRTSPSALCLPFPVLLSLGK